MLMKKFTLKMLALAFVVFYIGNVKAQEWNISSESFNSLGDISETITVEGLTIYAASDKLVTVDENSKTLDEMEFTHRLKLGGSGTFSNEGAPVSRVLAFKVTGNTTITIAGMSSSSSADRELVIAVDSMNNEIGRFAAMGSPITKGVFNYVGGAASIYLFSPSSGVNLYYIKAEPTIPDLQEWNISNEAFNALGEIHDTVVVDGLTIYASTDKIVAIDENSKTLDEMEFTHRLKLGGSGTFGEDGMPVSRVLEFKVKGNSTITIIGMSSSGSADRELVIAADSMNNEIGRFAALGTPISKGVFNYEGDAAVIYLFSPSSGVNIYYIKTEPLTTALNQINSAKSVVNVYPNPASDKVYVDYNRPIQVGVYNIAGSLLKSKLIQSKYDYISIGDLQSGIYLIRSQNDNTFAKKLIKK
jgi:hypothetical protein